MKRPIGSKNDLAFVFLGCPKMPFLCRKSPFARNSSYTPIGPSAGASLARIAALIKALAGPTPIAQVRLASIFVLEPRYLSRRLPEGERSTWSRLVGRAADLVRDPKVVQFAPNIPAGWRNAVTQLLGMRAIIEDSAAHTWAAGPGLDQFVIDDAAWPYGRATFVLKALSQINLNDAVADLPADDQAWVRASAA
jgi:hypothetical protein